MSNLTWRQMTNLRLWIPKARSREMSVRCRSKDPPNHKNAPSRNQAASGRCHVTLEKDFLWHFLTFCRYPSQPIKTFIPPNLFYLKQQPCWTSQPAAFCFSRFAQLGAAFACAISTMPCVVPKVQKSFLINSRSIVNHINKTLTTFIVNIMVDRFSNFELFILFKFHLALI